MLEPSIYVPFCCGAVPMFVYFVYVLGYKDLYVELKRTTRIHPSKGRRMSYWEKLHRRVTTKIRWSFICGAIVGVGVLTLVLYHIIRLLVVFAP